MGGDEVLVYAREPIAVGGKVAVAVIHRLELPSIAMIDCANKSSRRHKTTN